MDQNRPESVIKRKGPGTYLLEFAISLELVLCLWRSLNISTAELSAGSHLRAWIPTLPAHIFFRLIDLWWVKLNILIISWSRAVALHLSISIFLLYYFSSNKYLHRSMEEIDQLGEIKEENCFISKIFLYLFHALGSCNSLLSIWINFDHMMCSPWSHFNGI